MDATTNQGARTMYAFIVKKNGLFNLEIRTSFDLSQGERIAQYTGLSKVECRRQSAIHNAQPWNF